MKSKIFQEILDNTPKDVEIFVDWYADLVVRVNQILREKGISKKELAEKLEKKPSEISKWLNGEHNFTLRSIAKLQAELGEPLLEIANHKTQPEFIGNFFITEHKFTVLRNVDSKNVNEWQYPKENKKHNGYSNVG